MYSRKTELFDVELIIYIKMDLTLNNLLGLICHKIQPTNQPEVQERRQGELEIKGRIDASHTTALLKLSILFRRVIEIWEDLRSRRIEQKKKKHLLKLLGKNARIWIISKQEKMHEFE